MERINERVSPLDKAMCEWVSTMFSTMVEVKKPIIPLLTDVTALFRPERQNLDFDMDSDLGASAKIYDADPVVALNTVASGLFSWSMPPYSDWLRYSPISFNNKKLKENKELMRAAMIYADECSEYASYVLARSNFYPSMSAVYKDSVAYGTAAPYVEEDEDERGPSVTPLHIREMFVMENEYGKVDIIFRLLDFTPVQFVKKFSDSLTPLEKKEYLNRKNQNVYVLHTIYKRDLLDFWTYPEEGSIEAELSHNKKFASDYYLLASASSTSTSRILKKSGLDRFPSPVWRSIRLTNFPYGSSYAISAIYEARMLNLMSKSLADSGQLAGKPPYLVDEDLYEELDVRPGGITRRSNRNSTVEAINMSHTFPWGIEMLDRKSRIIYDLFQTNFFQSVSSIQNSSRERTKAEIYELKGEAAAALSAMIVNSEYECVRPTVKLIQENEMEHKRWPTPPDILIENKVEFDLELTGTLFQAQKRYIATQRIVSPLVQATQFANADSNVMLGFEFVDSSRDIARAGGLPERYITDEKTFGERVQAKAQAEEEMRQLQIQSMQNRDIPAQAKAPEPGSVLEKRMKEEE